jgi:hypothetical protein
LEVDRQRLLEKSNNFQVLVKSAKSTHFSSLVTEHSSDPRKLWQILSSMLHSSQVRELPDHESPAMLSERFSAFFVEKIARLHASTIQGNGTPDLPTNDSTLTQQTVLASFEPTTVMEVDKLLKTAPSKSSCLDALPTWLLMKCSDVLLPAIVDIVNAALVDGMPVLYKNAVITPLLKKEGLDRNSLNNYRPVSNLPYLAKLVERVVANRLTAFVESNGLHEITQSAYRIYHSTETAAIRVQHDLLMACEKR